MITGRACDRVETERRSGTRSTVGKGEEIMSNTVRRAEERDIPAIMELLKQVKKSASVRDPWRNWNTGILKKRL